MVCHDAEALEEGTAVVAGGHALGEVVGEDEVGVVEGELAAFGSSHEADGPVVVGREAVAEVVGFGACEVRADVEALVADEHAAEEALGGEALWCREAAVAQEPAFVIDEVGLAIDDSRTAHRVVALQLVGDIGEGGVGVEFVTGVEEDDVVAFGLGNGFVHGIVNAIVGFSDEAYGVGVTGVAVALDVALDLAHGAVLRAAVDDEVFYGYVGLRCDAEEGA